MRIDAGRGDGLCDEAIVLRPCQLVGTVCVAGGVACPLLGQDEAKAVLARVGAAPTAAVRLVSDADRVAHFRAAPPGRLDAAGREAVVNRKRDLDVLQRLGLTPGDTRRARYLYTLLFERVATPVGLCSHETPGWEGCPLASSGAYERIRSQGWQDVVHLRSAGDRAAARRRNEAEIEVSDGLFLRPHHLMCLACWHGAGGRGARPNDTLAEIQARIQRQPEVPVTLVEGPCQACDCCDGFDEPTGRCVHDCGLIRDYKKDLDLFCRLGLFPGDTLPARELLDRIFAAVGSTTEICGYGDGVVTSREWSICPGPEHGEGYRRARERGVLGE